MVRVSISAKTMCMYVLLLFAIATANGNQLGTVDGESINFSKNCVYVVLLLPRVGQYYDIIVYRDIKVS